MKLHISDIEVGSVFDYNGSDYLLEKKQPTRAVARNIYSGKSVKLHLGTSVRLISEVSPPVFEEETSSEPQPKEKVEEPITDWSWYE